MEVSKVLRVYTTELQVNRKWILAWVLGINSYILFAVLLYPGEEGVKKFLGVIDDPYFKVIVGEIKGSNPGYSLWISMLLPFVSTVFFVFALITGGKVIGRPITDMTGELVHTLPLHRRDFLLARWMVMVTAGIANFLVMDALLSISFYGEYIDVEKLIDVTWWGMLYFVLAGVMGTVIGSLSVNKASLNNFLFLSYLYAIQISAQLVPEVEQVNKYNPLSWYSPQTIFLGKGVDMDLVWKTVLTTLFIIPLALYIFSRRDLIRDSSLSVPFFNRRQGREVENQKSEEVIAQEVSKKSDRQSIFVLWVRPLEGRYPFLADFVYSERKLLFVLFWVIILFYPLQLIGYDPSNPELMAKLQESVNAFASNKVFDVFTYGHDMSDDFWLWLLITQSIGNHYFMLAPLAAHWIKKILRSDTENETGEIMGSIPTDPRRVLFERLFAALLELIFLTIQMVLWLLFIKLARNVSDGDTAWEVLAIVAVIPLYIFLVTTGVSLGLLFKRGVTAARLGILFLIFLFIASFVSEDFPVSGVFALYDPVLIIREKSLLANGAGVPILSLLAVLASLAVIPTASNFKWVEM